MGLTAQKATRLQTAGFYKLFDDHEQLWREIAQNAYEYTAKFVKEAHEEIRPDDLIVTMKPVLELSEELRTFLAKLPQKYWYEWFAELIIDRLWDELTAN